MTITPPDSRVVTTSFNTFPLNAVVAVDSQFPNSPSKGSGIIIAPNYVLTAGHNAFDKSNLIPATNLRTTISANLTSLNPRIIGTPGYPPANVASVYFPKNYDTFGNTIPENDKLSNI